MHSDGKRYVLLADSCPLMNDGLTSCLGNDGYAVAEPVDTVQALHDALASVDPKRRHLVILGPHLPEAECFALCRSLVRTPTSVRAILIVSEAEPLVQADAAAVGAAACLDRAVTCGDLRRVIHMHEAGYRLFSEESSLAMYRPSRPSVAELRVLTLLVDDSTYAEIADKLGLSTPAVRNHAQRLLEKHHVHTRKDLVRRARRLGWVPLD